MRIPFTLSSAIATWPVLVEVLVVAQATTWASLVACCWSRGRFVFFEKRTTKLFIRTCLKNYCMCLIWLCNVMYIISFINFIIYLFVYLFTFCFSVGRLEFQSVRFTSSQQNKVWIAGRITICTQMTANAILVMVFLVSGRQFFVIFSDR